MAGKKQKVN